MIMDKKILNETANYIYDVIRSSGVVCMSWGFNCPKVTIYQEMAALVFKVNGFIYKGWVIVAYNEGKDFFEIFTFDNFEKGVVKEHVPNVDFDSLIRTLDALIETDNDKSALYKQNVSKFLTEEVA